MDFCQEIYPLILCGDCWIRLIAPGCGDFRLDHGIDEGYAEGTLGG
jgi:hypothetical protein